MKKDIAILQSMMDAIHNIASHRREAGGKHFLANRATAFEILTIGEAAGQVSIELRDAHPEIEWRKIIGTRHRIVHGYRELDYTILNEIVENDLPDLENKLISILNKLKD